MWRARVLGAVDPVAESHHCLAVLALGVDVVLRVGGIADLLGHTHDVLRRAAVGRARERRDRRGHGSVQVGVRAYDHTRGERGGIGAVFGVEHEVGVHELRRIRARSLPLEHV